MKLTAKNFTNNSRKTTISGYKKVYQNSYETVYRPSEKSYLIVYNFGVYVEFNCPDELSTEIAKSFKNINHTETYNILKGKSTRVTNEAIVVPRINLNIIRHVGLILAESVAVDYYEALSEEILKQSIEYSTVLQNTGKFPKNSRNLRKFIGFCSNIRQEMLKNLYIGDLPESVWDDPKLEVIFKDLRDMFDLKNRVATINKILDSIYQSNVEIISLTNNKKAAIMELTIIGLITFEVLMSFLR